MEIKTIPKDIKSHEIQVRNKRLNEKAKMNIENLIRTSLRKIGALKINLFDLDMKDQKASIFASFLLKNDLKKSKFELEKNKFGDWVVKNFEASLENAEKIKNSIDEIKVIIPNNELTIDLSILKAIQRGNEYQIEHPIIGKIGYLPKNEINESNIKVLFELFAQETGVNINYINRFNVDFENEDYAYDEPYYEEKNSLDSNIQIKNNLTSFVKAKYDEKFDTLRESFDKVIKIEAADIVKKNMFSWKTGIPKIINTDTFVEIQDGKYVGNVLVKAKIGDQEKVFALPVERGKIKIKGNLENYIIEEREFEDLVKNKIENYLKEVVKKDMDSITIAETYDKECLKQAMKLNGIQKKNVLKTFPIAKVNLEQVEVGDIINLGGLKYRVEEGTNPGYYMMVLVEG